MENKLTSESSVRRGLPVRRSIGAKLIIAFLALAIIPMSATAYYNLTQGQSAVAEVARKNLMELSRSTAHRIEQLLTENQRTSATLAGEPLVAQFLAASDEEERKVLSPQIYQTLQNFADTHPDYDAPGLLDANGIVVASLEARLEGKDRSFRDYFQVSIQGQPYVSDMLVGRATGRPGVFLTNPVVTAEGEIVGINIVWLKGDTIWSIIDDVVVGEEGFAYLVDQDGVIIAHPDRDLLYHSLGELTPEAAATISATIRFGMTEDTETPLIPESLGLDDLVAELVPLPQSPPIPGGRSGTHRYYSPLDHRDHVAGYTRLEAYPWTVVVDLPEAQFLAPLQRLGSVAWGSVGLVAVITLIVSILLVRTITHPIRRLTSVAIAVEHSQPFEPADIEDVTLGRDEIAQLGRVFSGMVLALQQELTERKRAEAKLKQTVVDLKRSNADLEQFAYVASHDLQEPLRMVASYVQLLERRYKGQLDADADDFIAYAVDGANRMQALINDLLAYSRVGTRGQLFEPTDCKVALDQALANLQVAIEESGAVVTHDGLPTVMADGSQLVQLFQNLIDNGIKFRSEEPPRIHVSAKRLPLPQTEEPVLPVPSGAERSEAEGGWGEGGSEWVFSVRDNGIGIDSEFFERIFIIFQRLHSREEHSGTGIGLAICKKIVERHGGRIWVESQPGKGSTFFFTLRGKT